MVPAQLTARRARPLALLLVVALVAIAIGSTTTVASRPHVYRRTGIDVSHWQGRIDWALVAASGVDFAIIKATEGSTKADEWYHRNRVRARRAGLYVAAYHFAHPGLLGHGSRSVRIRRDARSEARFFLHNANVSQNDLIPALDLELSGGLEPIELRDWTMTFLATVQHAIGAKPMVYSTAAFWRTYLGDTTTIARAGFGVLWVAHWDARTPDVPSRKWLGRGWTFWQWTDCGRVPGIYDCVDRNTYTSTKPLKTLRIRDRQVHPR